jgi:DNA-binding response OmpR family regulator
VILARILLVEDDENVSHFIARRLKQLNHATDVAYDGVDALSFLEMGIYDLVILDRNIPPPNGLEVLAKLRTRDKDTKVLLLTSLAEVEDKLQGFGAGADDYLAKPFDVRELEARLNALLSRPTQTQAHILRAGKLELNKDKFEVRCGDRSVRLLPKDFSLLEFLMNHPSEVFSPDALIQRVWTLDSNASIEGLRMAISRIRKQLDDDSGKSIIENVNRVGYRLNPPQ